ncbi:MAG: ATP-binding protein [Victivallales bacterium]
MKDLSLHILDIVENSVKAGAKTVTLEFSWHDTFFSFRIADDGPGFPKGVKEDPSDPFRTTRKERKVGLGLALLKDSAEQCGGKVKIGEGEKCGVKIEADFDLSHIDSKPVGDVGDLIVTCMTAWPHTDWIVKAGDEHEEILNTVQIRAELGDINMNSPEIRNFLSRQLSSDFQPMRDWLGKIKVSLK